MHLLAKKPVAGKNDLISEIVNIEAIYFQH